MFLLNEKKIVFLSLFLLKIKEVKSEENEIIIKNKCDEYCSLKGGNCNKYGICSCKNDYDTFINENKILLCDYKKYNKTISASLELMLGNGFGHIYCKRYINGFCLLIINFIIYCFSFFSILSGFNLDRIVGDNLFPLTKISYSMSFIIILFTFFWRIRDAIYFMTNKFKDGNGIDLY
jgi:hypothetical protein